MKGVLVPRQRLETGRSKVRAFGLTDTKWLLIGQYHKEAHNVPT
jgi:hypothetical protein